MTTCIALDDKTVRRILTTLTKEETIAFRNELAKALQLFSTAHERKYQPEPAVVEREGRKILFRPFTSQEGPGIKIVVDPTVLAECSSRKQGSDSESAKPTLHGVLVLCDQIGRPTGLVNADEITGYRTSLSVMIPYLWRFHTEKLVVFGAGKQALWHVRLALVLRGEEIKGITIVNRSPERSRLLLSQLHDEGNSKWPSAVEFRTLDHGQSNYDNALRTALVEADAIFCTTPSRNPLFPASYVTTNRPPKKKGCYISGVGSWQADMAELDPELLVEAASRGLEPGSTGGAVIVDDREGASTASGEVIRSKLKAEQLEELGELLNLSSTNRDMFSEKVKRHLAEGLVVYKSIGVSLTDLAAGNALLASAKNRGLGVSLSDF
ncbi:hypothetical protein HRR83_004022 [Exophiala dermatitidis]|uniref:Ornithine cyclodeaminase n=2 Tax=Exophiala dermatitidis TaxID=5970 RepID=H6BRX5_EXODN|nr:ornithine cyclodeaminase [Exophiala dermatitidis NIH/UT8656]KAJ4507444.1 hypothetical protein HRR73_007665 [Exophiala dermatitidis]EHY54803.1 ornithine cyclodeaminase [Exophiala dermatitidis NIH/UT8656]KAJ4517984.1 hypothetical protein HRR75_003205 [Exophiala dermatitidis]KAJ4521676.1 hypothetical protein HRR74_003501 [Exophiala dermatitidis]KAJ4531749.1 hypothetical protein HRR77_009158 [Exophiala dermatitidis]